ncbi:MAG: outer membrane lipoprotein-sorting protein [Alteromonadaceae bacterium]|nr:MAG: outer membrane lipoprotein-sorting protein [Alteromonadaceae bacterium]
MKHILSTLLSVVIGLGWSYTTSAEEQKQALSPEAKGLEIAVEAQRRDNGFIGASSSFTMILRDSQGNERPRHMRSRTMEVKDDGDKSMIIFDNPGDVKGTTFLSYTHKQGADDQWLYLPALGKVKRISSRNKAGSFMNSEFAFEDIASQEVEKYTYKYLKDATHEGISVFVLELDPTDEKSGYSKIHSYIDQQRYIPLKIDFFDRAGQRKKTLLFTDYRQYKDKFWRASNQLMQNHLTGKSTLLKSKDWVFGLPYTDKDFNKNSLARAK